MRRRGRENSISSPYHTRISVTTTLNPSILASSHILLACSSICSFLNKFLITTTQAYLATSTPGVDMSVHPSKCPAQLSCGQDGILNVRNPDSYCNERIPIIPKVGCDAELLDGSFIHITHIDHSTTTPGITGPRLLQKADPDLFMAVPDEKHELVQLSRWDDEDHRSDVSETVSSDKVVRYCKIIYTNRPYAELSYDSFFAKSPFDRPLFFCRFASTDQNLRFENRITGKVQIPILRAGNIQRIRAHEIPNFVILGWNGFTQSSRATEEELRVWWRGELHTRLHGSHVGSSCQSDKQRYTFAEAFCGSGGPSLGAYDAGLRLTHAFDCDLPAMRTYRKAFKKVRNCQMQAECLKVCKFLQRASGDDRYIVDILHMSPPCQPFCGANVDPDLGEKSLQAFNAVGELLKVYKPRFVTLEEVAGLGDCTKRDFFGQLVNFFVSCGYSVRWQKFNLALFGVPQTRTRFIFIAAA